MAIVHIEGLRELDKALGDLPIKVRELVAESAARAGANVIKKEWIRRAPRGTIVNSKNAEFGPLHKNIKVKKMTRLGKTAAGFIVHTGNAFWGHFVEFGFGQPAQPWARPGFDTSGQPAIAKFTAAFKSKFTSVAKQLAGPRAKISKTLRRRI